MTPRERLAGRDLPYDPETVTIEDADVLETLEPSVQEWWLDQFAAFVPQNDGFFTPPQREAIPLIHEGTNTLVCSPTGSGKCVKPDTPLLIQENGQTEVVEARELLNRRNRKVADVDRDGELHTSDVEAYAYDESDGDVERHQSLVYSESYDGPMHRIQTVYGREVEVTPAHPLLVETEDGTEWRPAERVSEGDRIGVPERIDLPEHRVELDVSGAIGRLRERFETVITHTDSVAVVSAVESADQLGDLTEETIRRGLALAGLTFSDVADRTPVSLTTVHKQVHRESSSHAGATLELIRESLDPLEEQELLVVTGNGRRSRFQYPTSLDEQLAEMCAFVLAEGLLAEYERSAKLMISQKNRSNLLQSVLDGFRQRFGVTVRAKNEIDHVVGGSQFAVFFAALFGIKMGRSRDVGLPTWLMNAPRRIKRSFLSTFLSVEATVERTELTVTQASERKIEQLSYLLLAFGILPARSVKTGHATNSDNPTRREYYRLTVRGKRRIETLLAEFDVSHPRIDELRAYADGETAGARTDKYQFDVESIRTLSKHYEDDAAFNEALGDVYEVVRRSGRITERGLRHLRETLEELPDTDHVESLASRIDNLLGRNVSWLEVTGVETVDYDGEVIDLTVPGPHNFIGGRGGIYLHNTLASFTSIIDELYRREREQPDGLDNSVYCLYVSPLKSLANDIHRNLGVPLEGIRERLADRGHETELRHAIRHGDTSDSDRQAMLDTTPHILNTTPETLAILLNSPKFSEKLRTVEYVIVDEIHSLAENKRGTHLAVSLERLENLAHESPTRIGCSATVEPLSKMAKFLVGRAEGTPPDALRDATSDEIALDGSEEAVPAASGENSAETADDDSRGGDEFREYEIVDTRFVREFDLRLECPTDDLIDTPREEVNRRFYDRLHELIQSHENTLVFTNTRSGAERVLENLRTGFDAYDETNSGCHHGSMSKTKREAIEEDLKAGDVDVVTSSTSLELGIDMPYLDLVVQVGSPKSVASLLQRVGRAGHQLGETVEGRVIALDRDELVECAVMLERAESGFVDRVFVPENAQDVAAQHVYGMAINDVRPESEVVETLRRAYPYRDYSQAEWEQLCRYLTAQYEGMEEKNVYAKIWRDTNDPPDGEYHYDSFPVGEPLIGKRGRMARVIYMTNLGTIPDSFTCDVYTRGSDEWVGQLDEEYLDTLEKGDVFVLGGGNYEFRYRRGSKVYVDPTNARPTVPSWFSERLPLSYDLGREILAFQRRLVERLREGGRSAVRSWLRTFPADENAVRALARTFDQQARYAGSESVATDERLVVEEELDRDEYRRRYYVHSNYGRRFNDGLSRLVAYRCARRTNTNVQVAVADNGFTIAMPLNRKVDVADVIDSIDPSEAGPDLRAALSGTDLLKRYFRINATRSLMILKRYKGYEKSAAEQQVSSEMLLSFAEELDDFAVIEETYREITEDKLNLRGIREVLAAVQRGDVTVTHYEVDSPSPRAFGLATLAASDVVLAEDESAALQEFHARVMAEIDESATSRDRP